MNKKQSNMKQRKVCFHEKGITLVALVVIIVILLILAGITVTMLFGENGIIKKAQEAKNATESSQTDEITGISQLGAQINNFITGTNNGNIFTDIAGKLDVTYKVEGTKVYFYPTIDGYNSFAAYCNGKVIPELQNIKTDEQKEQFVINYVKLISGIDVDSGEDALAIINSDFDEQYGSCVEVFNALLSTTEPAEFLLSYLVVIYDKIPIDERDNLILYASNVIGRMNDTEVIYETVEDLLKDLNNENNTSCSSLKEALAEEYPILVGIGLLYGATDINLEHNGQVITIDFDKLVSGDEVVLKYDLGLENKSTFVISNAFESKTFKIGLERKLNEDGFYYNTPYRISLIDDSCTYELIFCFFENNTCLFSRYSEEQGNIERIGAIYNWKLLKGENQIKAFAYTFMIEDGGNLSMYVGEGQSWEFTPILNGNMNFGTPKKNEQYGYYEKAIYIAENPEDIAVTNVEGATKVIGAYIEINEQGGVSSGKICDNGKGFYSASSSSNMENYVVSKDGRTITSIEGEKTIVYRILNGLYDLQ